MIGLHPPRLDLYMLATMVAGSKKNTRHLRQPPKSAASGVTAGSKSLYKHSELLLLVLVRRSKQIMA